MNALLFIMSGSALVLGAFALKMVMELKKELLGGSPRCCRKEAEEEAVADKEKEF